ncbi:MAG TPA: amidophosphoribosyltransferase, partial [Saprospiraceae bacterium]|nr:amidophosphoribosyltransferase [Saprospiraceae bacterium]
ERPAIQTVFNAHISQVKELQPGHVLIIKRNGQVSEKPFIEARPRAACSFERIYFSRGTDHDIYMERKKLGDQLAETVLQSVAYDFKHTVFAFVPNTAETAFIGLMEGVERVLNRIKQEKILKLQTDENGLNTKKLEKILAMRVRQEKLVVKDAKIRTFIADDTQRSELVSYVYDVTYGLVQNERDTLVLLDDSIVRGTTLRDSILQIASRLRPKKIIIVFSAPQIRYPDCYGIDMSKLKEFVAFQALVQLLRETGQEQALHDAYARCKAAENLPADQMRNELQPVYELFTQEELSAKIADIVTPANIKPKVEVIFQTVEGLQNACPDNNGDWYFSGNYPTPGGNRVVNRAFMNYMEKRDERAY